MRQDMWHGCRLGKLLTFEPKALSFCTTDFSYINISPYKTDHIFYLWVNQSLKLSRNTCFCRFKSSLVVNSHVAKPERLVLSKDVSFSLLSFKRSLYDSDFRPINLGDLNISSGV